MPDEKPDRRVQRTRDALKTALIRLIDEKGYDSVTVYDITERANVGRTTFYLHYESKDALLLDHHNDFTTSLTWQSASYEELMAETPPAGFIGFLEALAGDKGIYFAITKGKDSDIIIRNIQVQLVKILLDSLQNIAQDQEVKYKLDIIANYLAGAQLSLIDWWLTTRNDHSAEDVANLLHQMQRSALRDILDMSS